MSNDLYQEQIIEWAKKSHAENLEPADYTHTASNPLCGDKITVALQVDGEIITAMAYQVRGCLLCQSSSAILADWLSDHTLAELLTLRRQLELALTSGATDADDFPPPFRLFQPVGAHKSRHACVLLPFEAAIKAMGDKEGT